jgi:tRNA threonylcarbamoyl adenosine modification protein (Sua5/YciO/YrdC/YwlC family)
MPTLPLEVRNFEPHLALDGGPDGLDVFRRLLELAPSALRPGGALAVELAETNVEAAAELCRAQGGWAAVEVRQDLTRRPRVLLAIREGDLASSLDEGRERELDLREKVVAVDQASPDEAALRRGVRVLERGGVVVVPTDSVYGIGCAAMPLNAGLGRTFQIKRRELSQTLPWLIADASDLERFGAGVPAWAGLLAERLWPGALTLVVRASDAVPAEYVRASDHTIALRLPDSNLVRALARGVGCPLAITSANVHGEAAAASATDLDERLLAGADLVFDAGAAPIAVNSTIVDCTADAPRILREGAIPAAQVLEAVRGA